MAALAVALVLAACTGADPEPPAPAPTTAAPERVDLSFGVFGPEDEVAVYDALARDYTASGDVVVRTVSWDSRDEATRAYRTGDLPDVFLLSQRDLAWFTERELTRPVDELLDERGVSFGDNYSRDALEAFAFDNGLTCMPYSASPMVIFYNRELVDFEKMLRRGLDAPDELDSWTFDQFTAAAEFATRPGKGTRGVYIDPSLAGLSPFLYSGGGRVFNDPREPTSLAFSDEDTLSALERTLTLLRRPQITPTEEQLAADTPVGLFTSGKLGMIAGFRTLVPQLRDVPGLDFDVMPMPVLSRSATVGDVTGLCLSAEAENAPEAADFLVHVLSDESVAQVVRAGYLVPANVSVATSEAFLQPGQRPSNAAVFNASVRHIEIPPLLESWSRLEEADEPGITRLVTLPLLADAMIAQLAAEIDLESQKVLSPPDPDSPSESPSGSESPAP